MVIGEFYVKCFYNTWFFFFLQFYAYLERENLSLKQTEGGALLVSLLSTKLCFLDRKHCAE